MSHQPNDSSSAAGPDEDDAGEALPLTELDTLLARSPSRRKRLAQIGLVVAALVVIAVTFWGVIVPKQPPAPPVAVQPGTLPPTLLIESNVTYARATINGQPQGGALPLTVRMRSQPPYTITMNAPPFQPITCHFPTPATPGIFNPCAQSGVISPSGQAMNTLQVLFTLADLPPAQQQQITALISQAVMSQQEGDVPAQSHIIKSLNADGTIASQLASAPLHASALLVPGAQAFQGQGGTFCDGLACVDDTSVLEFDHTPAGAFWEVSTPVALRWRFTTASGQTVSDVTLPASSMVNLFLSYDAATGWQMGQLPASSPSLSTQLAGLLCGTGAQMLGVEQARYLSGEGWDTQILHDQGLAGCELELTQNQAVEGHFVWRFGALLAADAQAHSAFPTLPVASPTELAAAGG